MTRVLLLPGLYNSGPEHWQSHWERELPDAVRIVQRDWDNPVREEWVATLEEAVAEFGSDVVLVGHSTACALVAFWAGQSAHTVRGALLVAPSDTEAASYPAGPTGWAPMPTARLYFPTIVVTSTDDEYVTLSRATDFARAWESRLVDIGPAGHINSASALGSWPRGKKLLAELTGAPAS
ncbi:MAG: alpha/beta hydrolase [Chthoniobacterales bacterium]|nr:alpha/beta hydrolase [Gemmatimonadaceae bacterium]MBA3831878.1 alpha/beta hydrolase [Chthoniobacterales bacterium]